LRHNLPRINPIARLPFGQFPTVRSAASAAGAGIILCVVLLGCGGGGGGGGGASVSPNGRSFAFTSGTQAVDISIDSNGRFTIFGKDPANAPTGAGGQGTIASDGKFFTQSSDGSLQFTGQVSSDATTATGFVQHNGANLFPFTASLATGSTPTAPANLTGTYTGTSGTNSALLTIDASSHATLVANLNGTQGGGLLNLTANGAVASADGSVTGQLTQGANGSQPVLNLQLTKLNGAAVNVTITLTRTTRAKWSFLVYLNGANDLQTFGPLNFNQMEKVGSTTDVNIVVQWKQASCSSCGSPDWTGTRRYFVTKDSDVSAVHSTLVQDMGPSIDMGDWHQLRNFIVWGQQNYPADHYALVIWNHGAGWRGRSAGRAATRGVSFDDATGNYIQTWELPQALGVTPKMDTVIFDASLMQMLEVDYEIKDSTGVVTGSEESPPGEGYVYDTFLSDLVANPNMSAAQLGTQIVNRTLEAYGSQGNNTQSAVDTSKLANLTSAVDAFAGALLAHRSDSATALANARINAEHMTSSYAYYKDLWDYAELVRTTTTAADLQSAASNVETAISGALIAEKHGALHARSHGLTIYVPDPLTYLSTYGNLAFARNSRWPQWLQQQAQ
jgi:hypothetical protein